MTNDAKILLEIFTREIINEVIVRKGYSLKRWNKLSDKRKTAIRKKDKGRAVWAVKHCHPGPKKGKSIYKKKPYTTLAKANARHTAIMFSKGK